MTGLVQLFLLKQSYSNDSYRRVDISQGFLPVLSVELHHPDREFPQGYFSVYWPSVLSDRDGMRSLAESYARLRTSFLVPREAEHMIRELKKLYGEGEPLKIILGQNPVTFCSDDGIHKFGFRLEGSMGNIANELSKDIPQEFGFVRLDSPFCGHYFGYGPLNDGKECGLISSYDVSPEVVRLFSKTAITQLPPEHHDLLVQKLEELIGHLPRLECIN